jgi:O-succinylbenzoic acid--CoA ligase
MNRIPCPISAWARRWEELPALIADGETISYRDCHGIVAATADLLLEAGIAGGERVAIISPNSWEYAILLHALWRTGAVACPVSPRFPEEAIRRLLSRLGCGTVYDPLDRITWGKRDGIRKIGPAWLRRAKASNLTRVQEPVTWDLERDATITFTSGSSGDPKAVLHTLSNHYYSALGSNRNIPVEPGDRWLLSLPLFHVGGLGILFRMALNGGAVVLPAEKESIAASIIRHGITHLSLVATQLHRLLSEPPDAGTMKQLKAVLVGGGAVSSPTVSRALDAGLPVFSTYGLTEMSSQVATTGPNEAAHRVPNSGRVLDYRQLKIDDGEILVKGETLFRGYVEEEGTMLPVDEEGWFRTGDLGSLDPDGDLLCLGRKDNMFISGGENIHPEEIEVALGRVAGVSEAVVVPVEDEEFGFRPVAFVRLGEDREIGQPELVSCLERHLPRFKIPIRFFPWPEDTDGRFKPDRRVLRKMAQALMKAEAI